MESINENIQESRKNEAKLSTSLFIFRFYFKEFYYFLGYFTLTEEDIKDEEVFNISGMQRKKSNPPSKAPSAAQWAILLFVFLTIFLTIFDMQFM